MDEKNGGFDVNFINELQDSYRCLICGLALRKPVQVIECGHRFCWHCLNKRKKSSDERHVEFCCPCCPDEKPIDSSQVFPDKGIERTILNLHIKCSNFQKGCLWAEELNQLENHLKNDCQHELVTCKVENCDECVERYQLEEHECNCTVVQNNIFLNLEASLKALSERLSQCESQLKAKEDRLRMYENVMAENNEQRLFLSRKLESTEKRLAFVEEEFGRRIKELERNIAVPPQGYTNTELISMKLDEIPDLPLTSTRQLSDERTSFTETMLPGKPSFCHPQSTKDSIETSNTNKFGTVIPLDERQSVILTEMHSPAYSTIRRNNHKVPPSPNPPLIPPIPTDDRISVRQTHVLLQSIIANKKQIKVVSRNYSSMTT